jgi:thioredoxin 1
MSPSAKQKPQTQSPPPRFAWWKWAIVLTLAGAIVAVLIMRAQSSDPAETPGTGVTGLPRLLELGADQCVPCQMMQPILAELRQEYPGRLQVDFIDVWKNPEEAQRYQIQAIPTQLFFDKDGKEIFRHLGLYPKEEILAKFAELGIDLTSP